jgi:hypothetical protein
MVLRTPELGLQLCFDALSQKLHSVAVNLAHVCRLKLPAWSTAEQIGDSESPGSDCGVFTTPVHLSYKGRIFAGTNVFPFFSNIYSLFGPTYPGEYMRNTSSYTLKYPGEVQGRQCTSLVVMYADAKRALSLQSRTNT